MAIPSPMTYSRSRSISTPYGLLLVPGRVGEVLGGRYMRYKVVLSWDKVIWERYFEISVTGVICMGIENSLLGTLRYPQGKFRAHTELWLAGRGSV